MKKVLAVFALVMAALSANLAYSATDYDFFGAITNHNDVLKFNFSVTTSDTRVFFTSSWDEGNFDPMLGLWSSAGDLINFQDDGHIVGSTISNGVSYTHGSWDSYYSVFLTPGSYILTLGTYNNFNRGLNLSDGFQMDGTSPVLVENWFQPSNGVRGTEYAFHIVNVETANQVSPTATPEPGTMILMGVGAAGVAWMRRRKMTAA